MPISRKTTTPRAPRKATSVRVRKPVAEPVVEAVSESSAPPIHEQIVNADYKRELIRAHAAMRQPHDPVQMLSVWAGVLATLAVVVGAWWWASKPGLIHSLQAPWTTGFEPMIEGTQAFKTKVTDLTAGQAKSLSSDLQNVADRLNALDQQQKTSQNSLQRMAALIQADATGTTATPNVVTTSVRPLFRAQASSTIPTTTSTSTQF